MGTTISGQTIGALPLSRTTRVPIGSSKSVPSSWIASTWSPVVVPFSALSNGAGGTIVSDATNGLAHGVAPPAGATGQEAAINAGMAAVFAASGGAGATFICDVALALGAPLYYPGSNVRIIGANKACGFILRSSANCPIIRSPGTNLNMTVAQNTQNTFGKYDPGAPGGSLNYRLFDPAFVAATNLELSHLTLNGAAAFQTGGTPTTPTVAYGFGSCAQFWGVDGLRLDDLDVFNSVCYHIHICNARNVVWDKIRVQGSGQGTDGIHFNGPDITLRGGVLETDCGDDSLALNADDGGSSGNLTIGINFPGGGAITDVVAEGPDTWGNSTGTASMRLNSGYHRIDDVVLNNIKALQVFSKLWNFGPCPGNGNFGRITFRDQAGNVQSANGNIQASGFYDSLRILGRYCYNAQATADIIIDTAQIAELEVDWAGYQPLGATNNTQPAMTISNAHVRQIRFTGDVSADASIGPRAAPFIRTLPGGVGGSFDYCVLDVIADGITNLIDHTAPTTLGTVVARGIQSGAGGGSPAAVASGATITNLCVSAAGGGLAYVLANGAKSGAGTVTHTDVYSGP